MKKIKWIKKESGRLALLREGNVIKLRVYFVN